MHDPSDLCGGCLCGDVRYAFAPTGIFDNGYCHYLTCRRITGAPVLAWVNVEPAAFRIMAGTRAAYPSSVTGDRVCCECCGSQLWFPPRNPDGYVSVNAGTMDRPEDPRVAPRVHLFSGQQLCWLGLADPLPRYPAAELPHPDRR